MARMSALAGGDHVGKRRERLWIHERDRAANHHERVMLRPRLGADRDAGEPQHGDDVGVVPFEGDGEGEHVEIAHRKGGLDGAERRPGRELRREIVAARQEHALAHDIIQLVEEPVDRLEAQVGHSDEVRVRERERDAEAAAVRFADVADFAREDVARGPVGLAGLGACHMDQVPTICETELRRRRSRVPWIFLVYHVRRPSLPAAAAGRRAHRAATPARTRRRG